MHQESSLFESPVPSPVPVNRPKPQPVQAPEGVAERGLSNQTTVYTWLLMRRHQCLEWSLNQVAEAMVSAGITREEVLQVLENLERRMWLNRREVNGVAWWAHRTPPGTENSVKPVPIEEHIRSQLLWELDMAGAMGLTQEELRINTGLDEASVSAGVADLIRLGNAFAPKNYNRPRINSGGTAQGIVSGRFRSSAFWEGR